MKGYLLVLVVLASSCRAAPQNWPYRDSLMPYRYGYPASQTQYKYLPTLEDDEETILSFPGSARQDFVVGSDGQSSVYLYQRPLFENKAWSPNWKIGDRVRPTQEPTQAPGVVETGSVAPVVDPTKAPVVSGPPASQPSPPPPRPVGPDQVNGRPVQPPPFPPARPPPTPAPKEKEEEDEDDDESDEEADDDEDNVEEGNDDETDDEQEGDDDDEEEERRRQEPLSDEKVVEPVSVQNPAVVKPKPQEVPAPVVVDPKVGPSNKSVGKVPESVPVVLNESIEEVNAPSTVDSNEITKPVETTDDESSEEHVVGASDGVEALVPGYVTDQGEVLVPVDTVTGDQPISIIPDPYTPPTRGVPIGGSSSFRYNGYNSNPYFYSDVYGDGRQDSDEQEPVSGSKVSTTSHHHHHHPRVGSGRQPLPTGRNEHLTAFPPARTPELYAVINSRFPVDSEEVSYEPQGNRVIAYRVKQTQRPSVSVEVALSGNQLNSNANQRNPTLPQFVVLRNPSQGNIRNQIAQLLRNPNLGYVRNPTVDNGNPNVGYFQHPSSQFLRNPNVGYSQNPFAGYPIRKPYVVPSRRRNPYPVRPPYTSNPHVFNPNVYINRFINRTPYLPSPPPHFNQIRSPFYGAFSSESQFGPYGPEPFYGPLAGSKPVFIRRPVGYGANPTTGKIVSASASANTKQKKPVKVVAKKPTPVVYQDTPAYPFEDPSTFLQDSNESSGLEGGFIGHLNPPKTRRAAKMAKKSIKKDKVEKVKKDTDPLNILKKVTSKKQ